jgi:hypothetical protein
VSDELPYPPPPSSPPPPEPGADGNEPAPPSPAAPTQAAAEPLPALHPAPPPPLAYPTPPPTYPTAPWAPPAYPPPAQPLPAAYPPAPAYATPGYGYPPAPVQRRSSSNLWVVIAAVVVVVVLLVGVIAYVAAGYAFASSRISDAANAVNSMNAHRAYVNTTFDLLGTQLTSFEMIGDPKMGKSTAVQLATETQSMTTLVGGDDQAMVTARSHLNDQQWLTAISSGRLTASATRIDHARKAAASLKSATGAYLMLGQFFEAYFQAFDDFNTLLAANKIGDYVGESSSDTALQTDIAKALLASKDAPGLPTEYHDLLAAFSTLAVDLGKELNAATQPAFDAARKLVTADFATMNAITITGTSIKIKSYYQHYRDDFNAEMDKATT